MIRVDTRDADWHLLISKLGVEAAYSDIKVDLVNSAVKQQEFLRHMISVDSKRGFDSSNQCVDGWIAIIREGLYSNPAVEDIFVDIEDDDVDVWVVIPERDLSILHQIVEAEGKLFDTLVSGENPPFLIEFHVIYRCGRNVKELAPTRAIRLPR